MEDLHFESIFTGAVLAAGLIFSMLCLVLSSTPSLAQPFRACVMVTGTDDGVMQDAAVEGAREALEEAIVNWRRENPGADPIRSARRPNPNPYWRDAVTPDLYFKPDVVDSQSHTVCWRGVVSPVVCTAGARLCY